MLTRWKQPCVIWEASKLYASCSIGGAGSTRPSRCQYCGGIVRSPYAFDAAYARLNRKKQDNIALPQFSKIHELQITTR